MSAWGHGNFENDDALDWAASLEDADDLSPVEQTLRRVVENDEYLEAPDCSEALAAAEIVGAMRNSTANRDELPEECLEFLERCSELLTDELRMMAVDAVKKIVASSELQELWSESKNPDGWLTTQEQLLARLR